MSSKVRVGPYNIRPLSDGFFRLDGGAMFGVVPKVIWEKLCPPDPENRILLALRPFLIQGSGKTILIDPGIGRRWDEKGKKRFVLDQRGDLVAELRAAGVRPEGVGVILASHLHWDHIGAAVEPDSQGRLVPVFPNATVWVAREELESALREDHPRRASYHPEEVRCLLEAGRLRTFDGPAHSPAPGVTQHLIQGHSRGNSIVTIDGGGRTAVFWDDVVPTRHHLHPAFIMAFDVDQDLSFRARSEWIARAADGGWISMFFHDPEHAFGRIRWEGKKFLFEPLRAEEFVS